MSNLNEPSSGHQWESTEFVADVLSYGVTGIKHTSSRQRADA
jgi:hypothetical protein